ncbi:hypothetical protein C4D60_Mb10t10980 [Musa balbisiana]|uniref:MHD domain-containing protein n=1 Tax=Musa balbisiana TaxID=52838 RepID=A0A4S8IWA3_MUSBA|nr:hypothetical protein C4D60_Mb10t10980 [Musa balbisiana]
MVLGLLFFNLIPNLHLVIFENRGEVSKGSAEIFFRKVKFWKEDEEEEAPPVFVDINMEQGYILTSEIDGTIQMKSYLTGSPEIRLALNEDLSIGRNSSSVYGETKPSLLAADYIVALFSLKLQIPPDGEFAAMNYRMTQEFKPPFRVNALIEEAGQLKAEAIIKIRADFAASVTANTITVQMPVPTYTARVSFELESGAVGQTADFKEGAKRLEWCLKKARSPSSFDGTREATSATPHLQHVGGHLSPFC